MPCNAHPAFPPALCSLPGGTEAAQSEAFCKAPEGAAGGSDSRACGSHTSRLCLNHTARPGPGPGETGQGPPSTRRVCQLRKNLNSSKVVKMSMHSPGSLTGYNPRAGGVTAHSTHLFFSLGLLGSAASQTSYRMLTGYFTVF